VEYATTHLTPEMLLAGAPEIMAALVAHFPPVLATMEVMVLAVLFTLLSVEYALLERHQLQAQMVQMVEALTS
jgi:hypothetical protein